MTEEKKVMTREILGGLKFRLGLHLNGGSKFSSRSAVNDEWEIGKLSATDGSPHYRITGMELQDQRRGSMIAVDLTPPLEPEEFEARLESFIEQYNAFEVET